jgi:hypothetical protein
MRRDVQWNSRSFAELKSNSDSGCRIDRAELQISLRYVDDIPGDPERAASLNHAASLVEARLLRRRDPGLALLARGSARPIWVTTPQHRG